MIKIKEYDKRYREELLNFKLNENQLNYTNVPSVILDYTLNNSDCTPFVALNSNNEVVGFFVIEKYYQYTGFPTLKDVIFIRSLSINEMHQGNGYGKN